MSATVFCEAAAADRRRDLASLGRHVLHVALALALPAAALAGAAGMVAPMVAGAAGAVVMLAIGSMVTS